MDKCKTVRSQTSEITSSFRFFGRSLVDAMLCPVASRGGFFQMSSTTQTAVTGNIFSAPISGNGLAQISLKVLQQLSKTESGASTR